jgi:hypothetical protein
MSRPLRGKADHYGPGSWNVVCYQCGRKFKASQMRKHWQGYWVCPQHWEPRHPQDFVKSVTDNMTPPWTQPMPADVFVEFCTPNGSSAVADTAVADCAVADFVSPFFDPNVT